MIFSEQEYHDLAQLFDYDPKHPEMTLYAGYKPNVREIPNGDGVVDNEKEYLHVSLKYNPPAFALPYLARAHFEACKIAEELGVPDDMYPKVEDGTLRVLKYNVEAGTAEHTDFDLFTVNCYRSHPNELQTKIGGSWICGTPNYHIGELGEHVGLGSALLHRVLPSTCSQQSIVYFSMPSHKAYLTPAYYSNGKRCTVGDWLKERYARSRLYK